MKRLFKALLTTVLLASLAACAGITHQQDAGMTRARVVTDVADGVVYVREAGIVDGKEKAGVSLDISHPDGWSVHYSAEDVRAFQAHQVRAAVEEAVSEDLRAAAPGIVDSLTAALVRVLVP